MSVEKIDNNLLDKYGFGDGFFFFSRLVSEASLYQEGAIKYIDSLGRDHTAQSLNDVLFTEENVTIKIEKVEEEIYGISELLKEIHQRYMPATHDTHDTSCHLFHAKKEAPSFPTHTDPVDLIIFCISGTKTMEVNGIEESIPEGHFIFIPANTPHRATNKTESIMLSIGAEPRNE